MKTIQGNLRNTTTNINNNAVIKSSRCNQLRTYNKDFILVTYKQVFQLYITAIEHKTLNDHRVLSLHFPNATSNAYSISNVPPNRFHVQCIEETRTYHNQWRTQALGFYPAIPEQMKLMKEKERGICKPSQRAIIQFCKVFTYFIS